MPITFGISICVIGFAVSSEGCSLEGVSEGSADVSLDVSLVVSLDVSFVGASVEDEVSGTAVYDDAGTGAFTEEESGMASEADSDVSSVAALLKESGADMDDSFGSFAQDVVIRSSADARIIDARFFDFTEQTSSCFLLI